MKACTSGFVAGALMLLATTAQGQVENFQWLVGTWSSGKHIGETWRRSADGAALEGKAFKLDAGDTIVTEVVTIKVIDGVPYYVPDVAGKQGPVAFKMSSYASDGFFAENPDHDFPKFIKYTLVGSAGGRQMEACIGAGTKTVCRPYLRQTGQ